jgi:hypothetical protein
MLYFSDWVQGEMLSQHLEFVHIKRGIVIRTDTYSFGPRRSITRDPGVLWFTAFKVNLLFNSAKTTTTNFNNGNLQLNCRYQDSTQTMDTRTEVSDVTEASSRPRIAQLPASCDPPQPNTPVKQLVWVV